MLSSRDKEDIITCGGVGPRKTTEVPGSMRGKGGTVQYGVQYGVGPTLTSSGVPLEGLIRILVAQRRRLRYVCLSALAWGCLGVDGFGRGGWRATLPDMYLESKRELSSHTASLLVGCSCHQAPAVAETSG